MITFWCFNRNSHCCLLLVHAPHPSRPRRPNTGEQPGGCQQHIVDCKPSATQFLEFRSKFTAASQSVARTSTAEITVLECYRKAVSSPAGARAGAEGNRVVGADGARPDGDVRDWVGRSLDVDALLDGGGSKTGVYHFVVCQMCVRMTRRLAFLFSTTGSLQPGCQAALVQLQQSEPLR